MQKQRHQRVRSHQKVQGKRGSTNTQNNPKGNQNAQITLSPQHRAIERSLQEKRQDQFSFRIFGK